MYAAASCIALRSCVSGSRFLSSFSPDAAGGVRPIDTGDAAPTFVPGAIAATWLA